MNTKKRLWGRAKAMQLLLGLLLSLSLLAGCAGMPAQNPYMVSGAGLGAATGAAIGIAANHRNPWKGAAIGGLLGGNGRTLIINPRHPITASRRPTIIHRLGATAIRNPRRTITDAAWRRDNGRSRLARNNCRPDLA